MMFELTCHLIALIVRAFALPIVRNGVWAWAKLYTSVAPADERDDRRRQIRSDLHDEAEDSKSDGYTPAETAVRISLRMLRGVPDDLAWMKSFVVPTIARKLTEWGDASGGMRAPEWLVKSVAMLGFVNIMYWASGEYDAWSDVMFVNAAAPVFLAIAPQLDRPLMQRAVNAFTIVVVAVAIVASLWVWFAFRLYDEPVLVRSLSQCALVFVPPALILIAHGWMRRIEVFNDPTWPTGAVGAVIIAVSLILSGHVGLNAGFLLAVWAALAAALLFMASVLGGCLLAAAAVCHAGTKAYAAGLKVVAAGFRNLM